MKDEGERTAGQGVFVPPLQRVRLDAEDISENSEWTWKTWGLESDRKSSQAGRLNMAGVAALSRRLMAVERARVLGKRPRDFRTFVLEQEARLWEAGAGNKK